MFRSRKNTISDAPNGTSTPENSNGGHAEQSGSATKPNQKSDLVFFRNFHEFGNKSDSESDSEQPQNDAASKNKGKSSTPKTPAAKPHEQKMPTAPKKVQFNADTSNHAESSSSAQKKTTTLPRNEHVYESFPEFIESGSDSDSVSSKSKSSQNNLSQQSKTFFGLTPLRKLSLFGSKANNANPESLVQDESSNTVSNERRSPSPPQILITSATTKTSQPVSPAQKLVSPSAKTNTDKK